MSQCTRTIYNGTMRCPEPIDYRGGDFQCTEHALECCKEILADALRDNDHECAAEARADIARLEGREIHELARAA